ncbi:MAG TPA: hypothetical protein DCZ03_12905 [Gammaproteobacteria bacterium]|nr:hypothetical protein [Gammaproteobacteria bacterium]
MGHTANFVRDKLPSKYSHELVEQVVKQPYQRQTASTYLTQIRDIVVLREIKVGREKLFIHHKLTQLFTQDSDEFKHYNK